MEMRENYFNREHCSHQLFEERRFSPKTCDFNVAFKVLSGAKFIKLAAVI